MSAHGPFNHQGHVLTIQFHEVRKGGWVAIVAIEQVIQGKTTTHTFTWDWVYPLATRVAAIAGAKHQAIEWIDSQFLPLIEEMGKRWALPGSQVTSYLYDLVGNLTTVINPDSVLAMTYDQANRLINVKTDGSPNQPPVTFS